MKLRPALFLDRDGTLIEEVHYLSSIDQIRLIPEAVEALRLAHGAGLVVVLVTNQSAVARGFLQEAGLQEIHRHLEGLLAEQGARLDAVYYCPHHPEAPLAAFRRRCHCRKPAPGLLLAASSNLNLDLSGSLMVGDTLGDVEAGKRAGCTTALVMTGYGRDQSADLAGTATAPDYVADNLLQAVRWFLDRGSDRDSSNSRA